MHIDGTEAAEDAVQEALVGALKNARTFAGRAALKTWVPDDPQHPRTK
jgi:DNA-directed RNA polymerase specialized sigma24 family protein